MDPLIVRAKDNGKFFSNLSLIHKLLLATTLILIATVGFLGYSLWGTGKGGKVQGPSPAPTSFSDIVSDKDLETCAVKMEGNPLVADVRSLPNGTIVGNYRGTINKIETTDGGAAIEVVSPRGDQTHTFAVKEEDGLVYDAMTRTDLTLAGLEAGNSVVISFNCLPDKNNLFKLTRIAVVGRLQ